MLATKLQKKKQLLHNETFIQWYIWANNQKLDKYIISEFTCTQQDGRKWETGKRLCVTNVTGILLACFVVIFTKY